MGLKEVRQLRDAMRSQLPSAISGRIDDDTIGACFGMMTEVVTLHLVRLIQSENHVTLDVSAADRLMRDVSGSLGDALSSVFKRHLPNAELRFYAKPPDLEKP